MSKHTPCPWIVSPHVKVTYWAESDLSEIEKALPGGNIRNIYDLEIITASPELKKQITICSLVYDGQPYSNSHASFEEIMANARLLASAPKIFEALELILSDLEATLTGEYDGTSKFPAILDKYQPIHALIKFVKGES